MSSSYESPNKDFQKAYHLYYRLLSILSVKLSTITITIGRKGTIGWELFPIGSGPINLSCQASCRMNSLTTYMMEEPVYLLKYKQEIIKCVLPPN